MGVTSFAQRVRWYRRALGVNPLIRGSDRLEALTALAAIATAFLAVPAATHAGTEVYDAGVHTATVQAHSRHSIEAVALEGSATMPADFEGPSYVHAQWHEGTRLRTEQVLTPLTVTAGETLTIWVDDTDKVVAAPLTTDDAKLSALGAAGTVWTVIAVLGAVLAFVIRRGLDRSRDRAWERELQLLAHNDDGWANRHT